jgi:hypothetical protein
MELATPRSQIMLKPFYVHVFFKVFFQMLNAKEIQMTAYHHQANGMNENFHLYTKPYCTM